MAILFKLCDIPFFFKTSHVDTFYPCFSHTNSSARQILSCLEGESFYSALESIIDIFSCVLFDSKAFPPHEEDLGEALRGFGRKDIHSGR